ncbi:tail fiber domain-containing protein [Pantoea stewartii]|uniref:tail fiber domain-containing protein n=1 Tax=Pantoea stewartii TaxID=66269 RepID=UPI00197DA076|nr:tail fiber domain-containing protein [Pantoea stewartii]
MPAGTIALSNNSDAVTGSGTSFTAELKTGDFLVSTVGGVAYTLGVKSIESDTALTLVEKFTGPSTSGISWTPIPYGTMTAITAQLAAQVTYAVRGFNLDKANWQGIFSNSQSVTVNLPDLNTFTGPGWGYLSSQYANKADKSALDAYAKKGANSDITSLSGITTALSIAQGGTGAKTKADAWTALATFGNSAGTAAQGNDARLNTVDGKSGGTITTPVTGQDIVASQRLLDVGNNTYLGGTIQSRLTGNTVRYFEQYLQNGSPLEYYMIMRGDNTNVYTWRFQFGGNAIATNGQWINGGSDIRIKRDFKEIDDPRAKLRAIRAGTWKYNYKGSNGKFGIGIIANDIGALYPDSVYHTGDRTLEDGTTVVDALSVEAGDSGVGVAVHHANLLLLSDEVEELQAENKKLWSAISELQKRLKAVDGLDA